MKRRILSIFCVLALCLGLLPVTALAIYQAPSGSGTKENPYQISTADELFWFASLVNGTLAGVEQNTAACAVLTADINLSGQTWIPIGDYSATPRNKYAGTFDGAGHTIDGLKADGGSAQGFVGYMDGGTIKNCTFNGTVTSSGSAGGICGSNYGTIENCTFNGTVTGSGNGSAGGICGSNSNSGTIKNCTSYGKVTSSKGNTGGICGYNSSTVTGCTNNAAVEGYFYFGGICGFNTGTITNCINKGEVKLTASQDRYMGGICGYSTNTITNCISSGKINGTCAAGICAWNSTTGTVTNCYWLTSSIGGTGVYDNDGTQGKVESKTATEFASGEVCWLLNNSSSESPVWYQNVDSGTKDNYPVLESSHGVVYRIERDSDVFYSNDPEGKLSIADATVSLSGDSFAYNGQSQKPEVTVKLDGKELTTNDYDVQFSGDTTNAGTVTVTVTGKGSYSGKANQTPTYTINKATPTLVWRNTSQALPYTGNPAAITAPTVTLVNGEIYSGEISYQYKAEGTDDYTNGLPIDAGTYTVMASIAAQGNYTAASGELTLTIKKAAASGTVTAVADLTYNGSAQALVTEGNVTGGTMQYRLGESGDFSNQIPTATDAGEYSVYYYVQGDATHSDTEPVKVDVTIAKKPLTVSAPSASAYVGGSAPKLALTYTGLVDGDSVTPSKDPVFAITKSDGTVISLEDAVKTAGTYTITWSNADQGFTGDENYDIQTETAGTLTVSNRSSGGTTTYPVQVEENIQNGGVQVSPKNAVPGTLVTVTPQPAPGYELATLSVLDQYGNEVDVNPLGNGNYSFKMPRSGVKVEATFYCTGSELCPTHHLADVLVKAWYHDAVDYVVEHGIMTGTSATTFEPNTTLSRAMVAQILYNLEGQPAVEGESTFTDASTHWAVDAITWAQKTGVVDGYENNTFRPNRAASREELAQMLYNYAKVKGYDLTASGDLTAFPDGSKVSSWAEAAMAWANGNELINGHDDGTLQPGGDSTRAQAASILMSFDLNLAN